MQLDEVRDKLTSMTCEVCGNTYDQAFHVVRQNGSTEVRTFDSFECAIEALAPRCAHCGCRVIGHGTQVDEVVFCCAHCARISSGESMVADRA